MSGRDAFDERSQGNYSHLHVPLTPKVLFLQASPPSPHLKEHLDAHLRRLASSSPPVPVLFLPPYQLAGCSAPQHKQQQQLGLLPAPLRHSCNCWAQAGQLAGVSSASPLPPFLAALPVPSPTWLTRLSPGPPQKCGGPCQGLAMYLHYPNSLHAQRRSSIPPPLLSHPAGSQVGWWWHSRAWVGFCSVLSRSQPLWPLDEPNKRECLWSTLLPVLHLRPVAI